MRTLLALLIATAASATTLTAKWNYDFTNGTVCATPASTNCLNHFEVVLINPNGSIVTLASTPIPPGSAGPVTGISSGPFTLNSGFGTQTIGVVMVASDSGGARITSAPQSASVQVTIAPSAPTGLLVTSQ